jgi:membrane fusion protein, multidrug efflux system
MLVASMMLFTPACSGGGDKGAMKRPPPLVSVAKAVARDVPVEVRAPVDLRPLAQADVGSKALGYLDAVLVDRGDKVKRGQTVALVRPSDLPDQLTAARGVLAQAQASRELAKANLDRAKTLAPNGIVSQQQLQQATASLATSEATEAAAKAQIGALAVRLGETRIGSPLDGVVTTRRLDPGALVGPPGGGAIVTVARTDILRVFISVNEQDSRGLAIGKDARVELDAWPGKSISGKVVRLAPGFDPSSRMLEAEVHLPNQQGELRPGMYGRGAILLETHPNATVLPVAAVQISSRKKYVFVLQGENKVQRREVEIGYDGGTWVEVLTGIKPGDDVVTAGAEGLADGMTVRVARDVDPYSGAKTQASSGPKSLEGKPKPTDKVAD